jgi:hypothetical protein
MLKRLTTIVCSISLCALITPSVLAAEYSVGGVSRKDIGVNEPAFIVSNPLYGMIDTVRGVNDSFVIGRLDKLTSRLKIIDRKSAELIKMRDIAPDNARLLNRAIKEYQGSIYQFNVAAAKLTSADLIDDSEADPFIDTILNSTLIHLRLIDELLASSVTTTDIAILSDMFDRFADTSVKLFIDVFGFDSVRLRLADRSVEGLAAVREAEMFGVLAKHAADFDDTTAAQQLLSLRAQILDTFASKLSSPSATPVAKLSAGIATFAAGITHSSAPESSVDEVVFDEFSRLVGGQAERIQTISYLLSRPELLSNQQLIDLRNGLLIQVFSK